YSWGYTPMLHKLTDLQVRKATFKDGPYLIDGGSLYLRLRELKDGGTSKRWEFRCKSGWIPLGIYPDLSLGDARIKAANNRKLVSEGIDPKEERERLTKEADQRRAEENAKRVTFDSCWDLYVEENKPDWKNPTTLQQWNNFKHRYVSPKIGKR